ncbi:MAG: M1 family peptidase [Alphaproteobacteria bacterium]|nr:MAG: M1 family peptidase [Alphaproteobacteria bacterium]
MKKLWLQLAALACVGFGLFACGPSSDEAAEKTAEVEQKSADVYPEDVPLLQLPEGVAPRHYALDLTLDPAAESFAGTVVIDLEVETPVFFFYLHGEDVQVTSTKLITQEGKTIGAQYHQVTDQGVARVSLDRPVAPGAYKLELAFTTPYSAQLDGIYKVEHRGEAYVFSQMQSISARRAFPCFDEPRFKTPFDVILRVPAGQVALTNGAEERIEEGPEGGQVYHFATSQPLATEILGFAVGPFDVVEGQALAGNSIRRREVPLRGFAPRGDGEKLQYLLETTEPLVAYFEEYFQQPYPFAKLDLVAVPDFQAGAMENAGIIMYQDSSSLVNDQTALTALSWIVSTHAHELSHQWFGNLVTPKWWDDIWLNESFANWIAAKASDTLEPSWHFQDGVVHSAQRVMGEDSLAASRRLREPIVIHDDIASIWDGISYAKGAGVLTMFEAYVGPEAFREGVRLHMQRFAGKNADAYDFLQSLADGSGNPQASDAMESFLVQAGVPFVALELRCDGEGASLDVRQSRRLPLGSRSERDVSWSLPLCYRTDAGEDCHLVTRPQQTLSLGAHCPAYLVPNRDSKGYYVWSLDKTSFGALAEHRSEMTLLEKRSMLNSIEAAYQGGLMDGLTVIELVRPFAQDEEASVVSEAANMLIALDDSWGEADNKPDFPALYEELFRDRFAALGLERKTEADAKDPQGTAWLRRTLIYMFANRVEDPDLRAQLTEMGQVFTGYQREEAPAPLDVPPELAVPALEVAHQVLGPDFGRALLDLMPHLNSPYERYQVLDALTASPDPSFAEDLIGTVFEDGFLRSSESLGALFGFMGNEDMRPMMLTWLAENQHMSQVARRLPVDDSRSIYLVGGAICSADERERFEATARADMDGILGAARALDQSLERIDQCMAIRAHLQGATSG